MQKYLNIIIQSPPIANIWLVILIAIIVSGCEPVFKPETIPQPRAAQVVLPAPTVTTPVLLSSPKAIAGLSSQQPGNLYALTHQRLDGNRLANGNGTGLQGSLEIPLSGKPTWVVGAPFQDGTIWAVALEDGQVQVFQVDAEGGSKGLGRKYLYRLVCPQYW